MIWRHMSSSRHWIVHRDNSFWKRCDFYAIVIYANLFIVFIVFYSQLNTCHSDFVSWYFPFKCYYNSKLHRGIKTMIPTWFLLFHSSFNLCRLWEDTLSPPVQCVFAFVLRSWSIIIVNPHRTGHIGQEQNMKSYLI